MNVEIVTAAKPNIIDSKSLDSAGKWINIGNTRKTRSSNNINKKNTQSKSSMFFILLEGHDSESIPEEVCYQVL